MRKVNPFFVSSVSLAALSASPAIAQQAQAGATQPQAQSAAPTPELKCDNLPAGVKRPADCETITVTGTRIRRPNLESPLPVTSIGGQEFFQTGNVSIGDKLAELPSIRSTFTQANSTRFLGTSGLNLIDLRGLTTVRTLVLVNGRRHVGGDVLNSGVSVDVNTIPTDLIDRVDVVTGGNSAVYGSDAIAGVVNFVLKDHYDGIQLRAQGGESKYSDYGSYFASLLAGKNFAGGRGNVAINVEYARQDDAFGSSRPWLAQNNGFVTVDTDPAGSPNGADGVPDRLFLHDIRSATFNNTGMIVFSPTGAYNCGHDTNSGAAFACPFLFTPSGDLVPETGQRVGLGPNGSFIGGNGENFRGGNQLQLTPKLKRYNVNLVGHFEVSDALVPFVEAKFSRTDSSGTGGNGPAFFSGTTLGDPLQFITGRNRERFRLDNPYLSAQALGVICTQRGLQGLGCSNPATQVSERQNMVGLGPRTEEARRDTYRIVGGIRGDFLDDWHYEASVNYGHLKETTKIKGNLDVQRFLLAMDAVRDPSSGNIVCNSKLGNNVFGYYPWFYYQYYGANYPGADPHAATKLAADVAACTPINPFGGNFTDAQRAYLLQDTVAKGTTSQFDATAFISGDTGKFFNFQGGPIGLVLGAEYRTDNVTYKQDPLVELGYTFYNAIPTFSAPKSKVKEAFGEISLPIVKDRPLFRELEIDAAARVSDYNLGTTGTVWAYNVNAIYSPLPGLRFRGNYARAVRAPNQVELFSPAGQNFAPGFTDPCSLNNIGTGSANRVANCAAAGAPAGYNFVYSQSLGYKSGGNPNLEAEKSDSYTYGVLIEPKFMPGFSLTSDYYNIKVNNAIAFVGPQTIVNACYDLPTFPNVFCSQFTRAGPGGGPHGEDPFQIIEGSLLAAPLNYAKLTARGIDTEIAYHAQLPHRLGKLDTRFTYTHVIDRSNFISATDPNFETVQKMTLGDPQDAFNWNTTLTHGRFSLGYQMRYISKMVLNVYEDTFSSQGRPPQNLDYADHRFYPSVFYHDVRLGVDLNKHFNFYGGIDNLTNTKPPLGLTGVGGGSAIYDNRGRFYYGGIVAKF
jgi:outer membrane receptor protein involved in Fe transport